MAVNHYLNYEHQMLNAEVFTSKFKIRHLTFVIFLSIAHQFLKLRLFTVGLIKQTLPYPLLK